MLRASRRRTGRRRSGRSRASSGRASRRTSPARGARSRRRAASATCAGGPSGRTPTGRSARLLDASGSAGPGQDQRRHQPADSSADQSHRHEAPTTGELSARGDEIHKCLSECLGSEDAKEGRCGGMTSGAASGRRTMRPCGERAGDCQNGRLVATAAREQCASAMSNGNSIARLQSRQDRCNRPSFHSRRRPHECVQYNSVAANVDAGAMHGPAIRASVYAVQSIATVLSLAATAPRGIGSACPTAVPAYRLGRRRPRPVAGPSGGRPTAGPDARRRRLRARRSGYGRVPQLRRKRAASPSAGRSSMTQASARPLRARPSAARATRLARPSAEATRRFRPSAQRGARPVAADSRAAPRAAARRAIERSRRSSRRRGTAASVASSAATVSGSSAASDARDGARLLDKLPPAHDEAARRAAQQTRAVGDHQVGACGKPLAQSWRPTASRGRRDRSCRQRRDVDQAGVRRLPRWRKSASDVGIDVFGIWRAHDRGRRVARAHRQRLRRRSSDGARARRRSAANRWRRSSPAIARRPARDSPAVAATGKRQRRLRSCS